MHRKAMLTGLGIGAGLMYFLDPDRGRRRRALVRDQVIHAANLSADAMGAASRDLAHRASGTMARLRHIRETRPVPEDVLLERVRGRLGRLVSHPRAIDVEVAHGRVTLRGPILRAEVTQLVKGVERLRGVREVVNALDEHEDANGVPALQGGGTPTESQWDILQRQWAPATRLLAGTAGAALAAYGASRRDVPGTLIGVTGFGLVARAVTNFEMPAVGEVVARRRRYQEHEPAREAGPSMRDATQAGQPQPQIH